MYIIVFIISVFVSSVSQIMLKKSANRVYENKLREYLNLTVIVAYGFFFLSSLGPILESSGYIWVSLLGLIILKEKINKQKWLGLFLIVLGIVVFNL